MKYLLILVLFLVGCNDNTAPELINLQKNCVNVTIGASSQNVRMCKIFLPKKDGSQGSSSCFVDGGTASFQISCDLFKSAWKEYDGRSK